MENSFTEPCMSPAISLANFLCLLWKVSLIVLNMDIKMLCYPSNPTLEARRTPNVKRWTKNLPLQVNPFFPNVLRLSIRQNLLHLTKLPMASSDMVLLLPAVNEFLWAFRKALRLGATDPECWEKQRETPRGESVSDSHSKTKLEKERYNGND